MTPDDEAPRAVGAFGDFSIEGLDDPLGPRREPGDVELSDRDQPPIPELPMTHGRL